MAHVGARIADIGIFDLVDRLVAVLAHGHDVGEHLRRVIFVGQPVVDRHAGVLRELLDRLPGEEPRYSIASYMRPSTRAVSLNDSLWPICEPAGSR